MHHPLVTVGTFVSILGLAYLVFATGNALENQVGSNTNKIESNEQLRLLEQQYTNEKLDNLSDEAKEIKRLLNQIILKI